MKLKAFVQQITPDGFTTKKGTEVKQNKITCMDVDGPVCYAALFDFVQDIEKPLPQVGSVVMVSVREIRSGFSNRLEFKGEIEQLPA